MLSRGREKGCIENELVKKKKKGFVFFPNLNAKNTLKKLMETSKSIPHNVVSGNLLGTKAIVVAKF